MNRLGTRQASTDAPEASPGPWAFWRRSSGRVSEAERIRLVAEDERQAILREAQATARELALDLRASGTAVLRAREGEIDALGAQVAAREITLETEARAVLEARRRLEQRQAPAAAKEAAAEGAGADGQRLAAEVRGALERASGETVQALREELVAVEIEEARAAAARGLRQIAEGAASPERIREAKRLLGMAVGRFLGHYLTERHISVFSLGDVSPGAQERLRGILERIAAVAGVGLSFTEAQDAIRIEGLDGVGREIARRTLGRILTPPRSGGRASDPRAIGEDEATRLARSFAAELDREIADFGRRAFATLQIPLAHREIVGLVGRLNWRTSFTQNQWKHAVEAAFLCGMMADELGLNRKLARRAALMHDIGKALTHEIDGSHAVIGADYARRLGEPEVVANAIGAHHTDEPFASPYAYLVAAADAMSGARPGARRQGEDHHVSKLAELERLSRSFPGVEEAFAVQGGREVRVYVREDRVDDRAAVALSGQIAETISREMTFPGQIRITVIRRLEAVETAS